MIALALLTTLALAWTVAALRSDSRARKARIQAARDMETAKTLEWMRELDMTAHEWTRDESGRWRRVS